MTRHFLEVDDLTPDELATVLDLSAEPIATPPKVLAGKGVALVFEKPSARTRNSTEMAVVQLGGHPVTIRGDEVGLDVRETVEDVTRTLAGYHAAIAARVFEHSKLERMAAVSRCRSSTCCPTTPTRARRWPTCSRSARRFGGLDGPHARLGRRLQQRGACRSRSPAALAGMKVRVACPPGYGRRRRLDGRRTAELTVIDPAGEAVKGADVVYTDVWTSMGQEAEAAARARAFEGFTVDDDADGAAPRPTRSSCTACPPTAARRSRRASSTARSARSGRRPRTACTPPAACCRSGCS